MGSRFLIKADLETKAFKALKDIRQYDEATQREIRQVVQDKTQELLGTVMQNAPQNTGQLRRSIWMSVRGAVGSVYVSDPVGHLLEYGTRGAVEIPVKKKALHPGGDGWYMAKAVIPPLQAQPFMSPAMAKVRPTINEALKRAVLKHAKT